MRRRQGAEAKQTQQAEAEQQQNARHPGNIEQRGIRHRQQSYRHHQRHGDTLEGEELIVTAAQRKVLGDQNQRIAEGEQIEKRDIEMEYQSGDDRPRQRQKQALQQAKHHVLPQLMLFLARDQQLRRKGANLRANQHVAVDHRIVPDFRHAVAMGNQPHGKSADRLREDRGAGD